MLVKEFKVGNTIAEVLLVSEIKEGKTQRGKPFKSVTLRDSSGIIQGKIWNGPLIGYPLKEGELVRVTGSVSEYQGTPQLTINNLTQAVTSKSISEFYPRSKFSDEELCQQINEAITTIKDEDFVGILKTFYEENMEAFLFSTAAATVHHAFVGGLAQHTLEVFNNADALCKVNPSLNRDLLCTAALLHDVGKIDEYQPMPINDFSVQGILAGHIFLGAELVGQIGRTIGVPETKIQLLQHLVLAHHGELEYGSPVKAAIPEAIVLHYCDNVSAKLQHYREAIDGKDSGSIVRKDFVYGNSLLVQ